MPLKRERYKKDQQLFQEKKTQLFDVYIDCPFLDEKYKMETLQNLQIFLSDSGI